MRIRANLLAAIAALAIGLPAAAQFDFQTTGTRAARILELRPTSGTAPTLSAPGHAKFFIPQSISGYSTGNIYISQDGGAWTLLSTFVGSGPVITVFGRQGNVVAVQTDYDPFFLTPAEGDTAYPNLGATETITGAWTFNGGVTFGSTVSLGGSATATTPAGGDNDTSVATTAFVQSETLNQTEGDARYELNRQVVYVKDFTTCDGVASDDTAGINSALTAAGALSPKGIVDLDSRNCRTTGLHSLNGLDGIEIRNGTITATHATNDTLTWTQRVYDVKITNVLFTASTPATRTGGWALKGACAYTADCYAVNWRIENNQFRRQYNGIWLPQYAYSHITGNLMWEWAGPGGNGSIAIKAGQSAATDVNQGIELYLDGTQVIGAFGPSDFFNGLLPAKLDYALVVEDADAVYARGFGCLHARVSCAKLIAGGHGVNTFISTDSIYDVTTTGPVMHFTGAGPITWAKLDGGWIAAAGAATGGTATAENLKIEGSGTRYGIEVKDVKIRYANGDGIKIEGSATNNIEIIANSFSENGRSNTANENHDIYISTSAGAQLDLSPIVAFNTSADTTGPKLRTSSTTDMIRVYQPYWTPSYGTTPKSTVWDATRLIADFSNATIASRFSFVTSTANGATSVGALPNGTATNAEFAFYNNATPTNAARGRVGIDSAKVYLDSGKTGSGSTLGLSLQIDGADALTVDTAKKTKLFGPLDFNAQATATAIDEAATGGATLRANDATDRTTFRLVPNGSVSIIPSAIDLFGTDFTADATNFERLQIFSRGTSQTNHVIRSNAGGTGTVRPLQLATGSNTGIVIDAAGKVLVGGALDLNSQATATDINESGNGGLMWRANDSGDRTVLRLSPNGSISSTPVSLELYGTDYDAANFERIQILTRGTSQTNNIIRSQALGTGTVRGLQLTTGANAGVVIDAAGNLAVGTTSTPVSQLWVPDGKYAQFEDFNAGAPPAGDCDSDTERGRQSIDTTNFRLYICMGATRGWDFVALTD